MVNLRHEMVIPIRNKINRVVMYCERSRTGGGDMRINQIIEYFQMTDGLKVRVQSFPIRVRMFSIENINRE
jgi:hypothetical protein